MLQLLAYCLLGVQATELTFELPDRDKMCFHEEIQKETACALEFQVSKAVA